MTVTIYRDTQANAIFVEDANGVQFLNSLQAVLLNPADTVLSIKDLARGIDIFTNTPFTDFVDQASSQYGVDAAATENALNAMFTGNGAASAPTITSPLSINTTEGVSINYELVATNGVGYEWGNLPAGLVTVEGNTRKLVGSIAADGVYTPTMKAVNYFGSDTETLTITVANPPYVNTKSVRFNNNDYLDATATAENPFYRAGNGTGSSDAWSISLWFKAGADSNMEQTILMFGGSDQGNEGRVQVWYDGSNNDKHIRLRYGTNNNYLELETPNNGILQGVWNNIIITYDGGTTGQSQAQLNDYYSRFDIFINGVSQALNKDHNNYGWSGSIKAEFFRVGRNGNQGNYLRNSCLIDELALWDSDQTANVSDIYNAGVTHDLSALTAPPVNWWRMGDGDTFPNLLDGIGSDDFVMFSMSVGDIVNDVP